MVTMMCGHPSAVKLKPRVESIADFVLESFSEQHLSFLQNSVLWNENYMNDEYFNL